MMNQRLRLSSLSGSRTVVGTHVNNPLSLNLKRVIVGAEFDVRKEGRHIIPILLITVGREENLCVRRNEQH